MAVMPTSPPHPYIEQQEGVAGQPRRRPANQQGDISRNQQDTQFGGLNFQKES